MVDSSVATSFASAERSDREDLERQNRDVTRHLFISKEMKTLLDALPNGVLVLNFNRQIVFANQTMLRSLGVDDDKLLIGFRPGEALKCVHAGETAGGCGTTEYCAQCGAVLAILAAQKGDNVSGECRIMLEGGEAVDLEVYTAPLVVEGEHYTVFAAIDISHEKRRRVLERTFFHDILNTATLLSGYAEMIRRFATDVQQKHLSVVLTTIRRLIDEIQSQRDLLAAETDELQPDLREVHSQELIEKLVDAYAIHYLAKDIVIEIDAHSSDTIFKSDPTLLIRVLGNMIKNALEASAKGERVTVGCCKIDETIEFFVHNEAVMPKEVQLQLFMRSFSTKGEGRGIGTYSMKLFTERYLKGKISFTSEEGKGTTFVASCPLG